MCLFGLILHVTFKPDNVTYTVEVLGRAGKAKFQYRDPFNLEYKEPSKYVNKKSFYKF